MSTQLIYIPQKETSVQLFGRQHVASIRKRKVRAYNHEMKIICKGGIIEGFFLLNIRQELSCILS